MWGAVRDMRQNMVGPGEVDDELERETSGECERFGPVRRCLIFEIKVTTNLVLLTAASCTVPISW